MRIVRQQFGETAKRQERAIEYQRAAAALAQCSVAIKLDCKVDPLGPLDGSGSNPFHGANARVRAESIPVESKLK